MLNAENTKCRITLVMRQKFLAWFNPFFRAGIVVARSSSRLPGCPARRPCLQLYLNQFAYLAVGGSSCRQLHSPIPIVASGKPVSLRAPGSWSASVDLSGRRGARALSYHLEDSSEPIEPRRKSPLEQEHYRILRQFPGAKITVVSIPDPIPDEELDKEKPTTRSFITSRQAC